MDPPLSNESNLDKTLPFENKSDLTFPTEYKLASSWIERKAPVRCIENLSSYLTEKDSSEVNNRGRAPSLDRPEGSSKKIPCQTSSSKDAKNPNQHNFELRTIVQKM